MMTFLKRHGLWAAYFAFVAIAIATHSGEGVFLSSGSYPYGKPLLWLILLLFMGYSLRVSAQENFFHSLKRMNQILWSRQVGLDLYIGLLIPLFIIYLNEGSLLILALWILPVLIFANLAVLLYLALNYDSIILHFI